MEVSELKRMASGRWLDIMGAVGIPLESLNGKHGPCPRCGGKDRFKVFGDFSETGGMMCNQCGTASDGIAALQWWLGVDFKESCRLVSEHIGIRTKKKWRSPKDSITPLVGPKVDFALSFIGNKKGIRLQKLLETKWCAARWPAGSQRQLEVLAFVSLNADLRDHSYLLYRRDGKPFDHGGKTHILPGKGSADGFVIIGSLSEFANAREIWKCEGITDALAVASSLPPGAMAIANLCGAQSFPRSWNGAFSGKRVFVLGDNDVNGMGEIGAYKAGKEIAS